MAFKELNIYKKAFKLAMDIFEISKAFPEEERYSLTDQIRRSSRSVCSQIGEAYRKKQYPKHFISKISDGDSENAETQVWLEFSLACNYISQDAYKSLLESSKEVGIMLNDMLRNPDKYGAR